MREALFPLKVRPDRGEASMVRFLPTVISPLVSRMVWPASVLVKETVAIPGEA